MATKTRFVEWPAAGGRRDLRQVPLDRRVLQHASPLNNRHLEATDLKVHNHFTLE
jgi:hypothetical protein